MTSNAELDVVVGLILAGGQSRRMGGGDKCLRMIAGRPMLAHVLERLAPQCAHLVLNANGDSSRFAAFALPVVADTVQGFPGPLAGVLAGLRWTAANVPAARWMVTVSADAPFVPADLVAGLLGAARSGRLTERPIALARSGGNLHPVIGLWPAALADDLEAALVSGTRKVLAWTDRHGTLPVDFPPSRIGGREVDPFFNVNTPDDLAEAESLLSEG
ncbi:MAG: Molybdenum cofactor guanylyltransferase [Pseudomonadota bacterium]|jgi:molybdopterin-guanine dinucleotide biosynthesis protein A